MGVRSGLDSEDEHFDRISQVREAIRRKRCEERGQEYEAPDEVQISALLTSMRLLMRYRF
jgi:hypothetical protein